MNLEPFYQERERERARYNFAKGGSKKDLAGKSSECSFLSPTFSWLTQQAVTRVGGAVPLQLQ